MEYGQDGSLESRLYLTGAGKDDTGRLVFFVVVVVFVVVGAGKDDTGRLVFFFALL